jgi:hypothetical protein
MKAQHIKIAASKNNRSNKIFTWTLLAKESHAVTFLKIAEEHLRVVPIGCNRAFIFFSWENSCCVVSCLLL